MEGAEPTPARLVGSEAVVLHLLPPILRAHLRLHPKARLCVRALPDDEAVAAVRQGEADLAVLSAKAPTAALSTRPLLSSPRVLASAREHPLSQGPRLTLDRLAAHDLLLPAKGSETHVAFDEACAREGLRVEPAMITASYETLMRYVGLGLGVALLPGCFADRPDRRVVVRSARHLVGEERYVLAWAGRAPASRSAAALLQHLATSPPVFAAAGGAREGRRR